MAKDLRAELPESGTGASPPIPIAGAIPEPVRPGTPGGRAGLGQADGEVEARWQGELSQVSLGI